MRQWGRAMVDTNSRSDSAGSAREIIAALRLPVSELEGAELEAQRESSASSSALIRTPEAHRLLSL